MLFIFHDNLERMFQYSSKGDSAYFSEFNFRGNEYIERFFRLKIIFICLKLSLGMNDNIKKTTMSISIIHPVFMADHIVSTVRLYFLHNPC